MSDRPGASKVARDESEASGADEIVELQRGIIGACLADGEKVLELLDVPAEAFPTLKYRDIAEILKAMYRKEEHVDFATVLSALKGAGKHGYELSDLADMARESLSMNVWGDIELLLTNLERQRVLLVARRIYGRVSERSAPPLEVAAEGISELSNLLQHLQADTQDLESVAREVTLELEQGKTTPCTPTGFSDLDTALGGGLRPRTLTILGAKTAMGKSAFSLQLARHAAMHGARALYFSIEMPVKALARRVIAMQEGLEPIALRLAKPQLVTTEEEAKKRINWAAVRSRLNVGGPNLIVNDDPSLTSSKALAVAHKTKAKGGLDLVVVDYIQLLSDVLQGGENRTQLLGRLARAFAILARRLDVAVLVVSQLSRHTDQADNEPKLSDLRDSGELEQVADNVLLLHRPYYFDKTKDEHAAKLIIAKQREGSCSHVPLFWDAKRVSFRDVDGGH